MLYKPAIYSCLAKFSTGLQYCSTHRSSAKFSMANVLLLMHTAVRVPCLARADCRTTSCTTRNVVLNLGGTG